MNYNFMDAVYYFFYELKKIEYIGSHYHPNLPKYKYVFNPLRHFIN